MNTTTVELSRELKEKIASFGSEGESYDQRNNRTHPTD